MSEITTSLSVAKEQNESSTNTIIPVLCNEIIPLPKLETKMRTLTDLLCDNVFDHLIFNVQENSSSQSYRRKLQDFLSEKQAEFYNTYIMTKYKK